MKFKLTIPPLFYVKAFWETLSYAIAGVLALLAYLGKIPTDWAVGGAAILAWFLGVLSLIGIVPELRMRAAVKNAVVVKVKKTK